MAASPSCYKLSIVLLFERTLVDAQVVLVGHGQRVGSDVAAKHLVDACGPEFQFLARDTVVAHLEVGAAHGGDQTSRASMKSLPLCGFSTPMTRAIFFIGSSAARRSAKNTASTTLRWMR